MNTWMKSSRGRCARWLAVGIGAMLATAGLATRASAEHSPLELVSIGPAGGNGDFDTGFSGASGDGSRVFVESSERLVSADTDDMNDVYERAAGQTTLVSTGPTGGNGGFGVSFEDVSADGSRVFFRTAERLTSADGDAATDVYERAAGQTTLVSTSNTGGNGAADAEFEGASTDGTRVFFRTAERLVSADTDNSLDVYERAGGQTTLVSTSNTGGNGAADAEFEGASTDGTRVFIRTVDQLLSADTDAMEDVYERAAGQTTLISTGSAGGNGAFRAFLSGVSADGTRVVFSTYESLVSADTDSRLDVYERSGGQTTLVSTGPAGGNPDFDAIFRGVSSDGSRVFFQGLARLATADTDDAQDVYERAGGQTSLVSTGPAGGNGAVHAGLTGMSADGTRVFFTTWEGLVSGDTDAAFDVYERSGGQTSLLSTGPAGGSGAVSAFLVGASADGSRVFFETAEPLASADTDMARDVYERAGGLTTLLSTGPAGGNGAVDARFEGASADGSRVFLMTDERLVSADTDTSGDVYVKRIVAPVNTARPAISGVPLVGRRLTCSPGSWDHNPTGITYRWTRAGVAINGATSATYTLVAADGARPITCTVTVANSAGSRSATSASLTARFPGACANVQVGGAGPDRLTGLDLGDALRGLGGNDVLVGRAGDDCLTGGVGNDTLRGDAGLDRFDGGAGNDAINSRDGRRETVSCGTGQQDRVTADPVDRLVGCEIVRPG